MGMLLVVGGSGLIGRKLAALGTAEYDVIGTYSSIQPKIEKVTFVELHKERVEDGRALIEKLKPVAVVDTAAFHNVDKCEEDRDLAWAVNAAATGALAMAATDVGARYLFVSTDFVFDGTKGGYKEDDVPRPVNFYGETKLAGERAVLSASAEHVVVRPSVVYGWDESRLNFATWVLTSLREKNPINVVTDWIGSPTLADELAAGLLRLLKVPNGGLYHLAGIDALSRYDFALRLAKAFDLETNMIKPVTAAEFGAKARRPPNSSLVNVQAKRYGVTVATADRGIAKMKGQRALESFVMPVRFKS